jgi:hypothetical protein
VVATDRVRFGEVELSVREVVEALEIKHPAALTASNSRKGVPPPVPFASPMAPLPPPLPPAYSAYAPAATPAGMVRCVCGAFKAPGRSCPVCRR